MRTEQRGDGLSYHRLSPIAEDDPGIEEGTDIWAINKGLISVTPLRFEVTDHEVMPALRECARPLESALRMSDPGGDD